MFVNADVRKHRLHNSQLPRVDFFASRAVNFGLHLVQHIRLWFSHLYREIPTRSRWLTQAASPHGAVGAIFGSGMIDVVQAIAVALVAGMQGQFLPLRTEIDLPRVIGFEIFHREGLFAFLLALPAVEAILEALLLGKAPVPLAKLDVGDVSIHPFGPAEGQALKTVIVAVCGQLFALEELFILEILFGARQHRLEIVVVLATQRRRPRRSDAPTIRALLLDAIGHRPRPGARCTQPETSSQTGQRS